MSVLTTKERSQFYSAYNYMLALREILRNKSEERIIKKIKKLTKKEAVIFLAEWKMLFYERTMRTKHLRIYETQECNGIIEDMYKEFKHLGIKIP